MTATFGGPLINVKAEVQNLEGRTIRGLYADGNIARGLFCNDYIGGSQLGAATVFGRIAACEKRKEVHYGYKGFLLCAVSKLLVKVFPTTAKVHDAKVIDRYLHWAKDSKKEVLFFADAGYTGKKIVEKLLEANMPPLICEKGRKGVPLTADQKQSNKMISSVRSRIEHAFGFIEESLGGSVVRSIGLIRAKFNITLTSLVYNICRLGQIVRGGVRRIGVSESLHRC